MRCVEVKFVGSVQENKRLCWFVCYYEHTDSLNAFRLAMEVMIIDANGDDCLPSKFGVTGQKHEHNWQYRRETLTIPT